jgi:hypothetical protein
VGYATDNPVFRGRLNGRNPDWADRVRVQQQPQAAALVRALARSHRNKSVAQVRLLLRQETRRLGLHLSPAALHGLADSITAGRPVHLP